MCSIMGFEEYIPIAEKYEVPIVITGFEPLDLVQGIYMAVRQLEAGTHIVEKPVFQGSSKGREPGSKEGHP